jgi:hypothetical protein
VLSRTLQDFFGSLTDVVKKAASKISGMGGMRPSVTSAPTPSRTPAGAMSQMEEGLTQEILSRTPRRARRLPSIPMRGRGWNWIDDREGQRQRTARALAGQTNARNQRMFRDAMRRNTQAARTPITTPHHEANFGTAARAAVGYGSYELARGVGQATSGNLAGGMSSFGTGLSSIGGALMSTGNPAGMVGGGLLLFTGAILKSVDALKKWMDSIHNSNMQFAEFSGAMAAVQGRQQIRDILLSIERGERLAPVAEEFAQVRHDFNTRWTAVQDLVSIGVMDMANNSYIALQAMTELTMEGNLAALADQAQLRARIDQIIARMDALGQAGSEGLLQPGMMHWATAYGLPNGWGQQGG